MSAVSRLKDLTRPTGEEDLLDVSYPTPCWSVSPRQAAYIAALVLVVVVVWLLLRPGPAEDLTDTFAPAQPAGADPGNAGLTGAELTGLPIAPVGEEAELVASVVGEVAELGLITLAPGARVADALAAAEPLPGAELLTLNRAQRLSDGQQLVVPGAGEGGAVGAGDAGGSGAAAHGRVSLNSATAAELTTLDGVGEKTAEAIIAHREATGGFTAPEQLMDVKGIGPAKFEALRDQVSL